MIEEIDADGSGDIDFNGEAGAAFLTAHAHTLASNYSRICCGDEPQSRNQVHCRGGQGCIQGRLRFPTAVLLNISTVHVHHFVQIFEGAAPKDHIRVTDLVDNLLRFGEQPLTKEQAQDLVGQLEADGNGLVNYVDFVNMMLTK